MLFEFHSLLDIRMSSACPAQDLVRSATLCSNSDRGGTIGRRFQTQLADLAADRFVLQTIIRETVGELRARCPSAPERGCARMENGVG